MTEDHLREQLQKMRDMYFMSVSKLADTLEIHKPSLYQFINGNLKRNLNDLERSKLSEWVKCREIR
ncbi:hypothetical protein [Clostridium perfringens]|uniref:Uncharacterized protein n=1 Tax=Clostridium perfringens TaxID=1502 RepID=A0AAN5ND63_CLOPF|nr:hypothetical protein [Clostridium perfringens]AQW26809.1 hypothetical protein BXT94_08525 [Clostridium perfringens]KAB8120556.1 hypothetical protein FVB38_05665 [Clostridium perfringens]KQC91159.1 hypothetical protein AM596_15990 [Clostridium perfringens CP4]MBI6053021.1 hypothetical protein [Clostridium perfringens]MBO3435669.1 hypothetical protein [Clostridium perfringens]